MSQLAGFVFDRYDDHDGRVLRQLIPRIESVPPFIKEAHSLNSEQVAKLPDDQFALVMLNEGRKLKKYAMVDKGNTALSVMYLLKQAHLLPPDAVKIAASNLVAACITHGMVVPDRLKEAALTGTSGVSGKSQKPYVKGAKIERIRFQRETPGEFTENPQLGTGDHNEQDVMERTNFNSPQGTNFTKVPHFSQKEKERTSPTDVSTAGESNGFSKMAGAFGDAPGEVLNRCKEWRESPYVDVSSWDPQSAEVVDRTPPSRTLLGDKYPVDSMEQVKLANDYFNEYKGQLHPRDRHEYCTKLASRMSELNMRVPEDIERYGSETYSADVDSLLEHRRILVGEELVPAINILIEKRAHVSPETFVEALEDFDKLAGLQYFWGAQIPDPWYTIYGPSLEKVANANWRYDEDGIRVGVTELEVLARNGHQLLTKSFGHEFADKFCKSPKAAFEALPAVNKLMVARMAMDRHGGTSTE